MPVAKKDPFEYTDEELDQLNIEEYMFQLYKEKLKEKPRRKKYWEREKEYRDRVMKMLEEIKTMRKLFFSK